MPPTVSHLRSLQAINAPKVADYTAVSPSEIMQGNISDAVKMQPFFVVGISLIAFIVMLMISMIFSFWQWRRQQRLITARYLEVSTTRPGDLYYRRAQRKRPAKRVRWQSVVYHDNSPTSASSETQLLLDNDSIRPIKTTKRSIYGATAKRRRGIDTPPPYSSQDLRRFQLSPYRDMPETSTTIDSEPMSAALTPPPVPKKSVRRPAPLTLIVISPTDSKHSSSGKKFKREPTPYPLSAQLTPIEAEESSSPSSSQESSSPTTATTVRPKLKLKIGKDASSPMSFAPSIMLSSATAA